jgi:dihydropyrimidinase
MSRTLISGGLVVTAADEVLADVLIEDEKVVAVTAPGFGATADTVIDATGMYVVPGGVDAHTHMQMPFGGTTAADTFETGAKTADPARCARGSTPGTRRPTATVPSTTRST